jgi:hypothetical protein
MFLILLALLPFFLGLRLRLPLSPKKRNRPQQFLGQFQATILRVNIFLLNFRYEVCYTIQKLVQ